VIEEERQGSPDAGVPEKVSGKRFPPGKGQRPQRYVPGS